MRPIGYPEDMSYFVHEVGPFPGAEVGIDDSCNPGYQVRSASHRKDWLTLLEINAVRMRQHFIFSAELCPYATYQ